MILVNSFCKIISKCFHKPYDLNSERNRILERERRLALTSLSALLLKIISTAIPLVTLKLTYQYLGIEVYGLWNTIVNFFALFAFSDLGLGYGLQTLLSQASGRDDNKLCIKLISTTYVILCTVSSFLFIIFLISYPFVDWAGFINATNLETIQLAGPVFFTIFVPRIVSIPLAIISRTQYALQEGYNSNFWGILGYILSLIFVILAVICDFGKIVLLAGSAIIPVLVSALNMIYYYNYQRTDLKLKFRHFDIGHVRLLLKLGIGFCLLSIFTTLGYSMDTFIVAKTCSLSDAGSYSIIYKVAIMISAVLGVFVQPLWGANGEAIARGDVDWVKSNTIKMSILMTIFTSFISIVIVFSSRFIFDLWLGSEFQFSLSCLIWLSIMQIFQAFISPYFMVLNALGALNKQLILFVVFTTLSLFCKFILVPYYGIASIPFVGAILYLLIIVIPIFFIANKTLLRLQKSI